MSYLSQDVNYEQFKRLLETFLFGSKLTIVLIATPVINSSSYLYIVQIFLPYII